MLTACRCRAECGVWRQWLTPRTGQACARTVLALVAWGDASLETAKKNGNITQITTIDHHSTNTLGFGKFCTVVHGK